MILNIAFNTTFVVLYEEILNKIYIYFLCYTTVQFFKYIFFLYALLCEARTRGCFECAIHIDRTPFLSSYMNSILQIRL